MRVVLKENSEYVCRRQGHPDTIINPFSAFVILEWPRRPRGSRLTTSFPITVIHSPRKLPDHLKIRSMNEFVEPPNMLRHPVNVGQGGYPTSVT